MEVITLGTGSPLPDPNRAGPATLVRAAGRDFLFDAGRGVMMRLAATSSGPLQIERVLLTHLHSDHVTDLNDLVTMRWVISPSSNPLKVVGPVGTERLVDRTLAMLSGDIGYRRAHHEDLGWDPECEVMEVADGVVLADAEVRITAAPTEHAPVKPTVGYRVEADGKAVAIGGDTLPARGSTGSVGEPTSMSRPWCGAHSSRRSRFHGCRTFSATTRASLRRLDGAAMWRRHPRSHAHGPGTVSRHRTGVGRRSQSDLQ